MPWLNESGCVVQVKGELLLSVFLVVVSLGTSLGQPLEQEMESSSLRQQRRQVLLSWINGGDVLRQVGTGTPILPDYVPPPRDSVQDQYTVVIRFCALSPTFNYPACDFPIFWKASTSGLVQGATEGLDFTSPFWSGVSSAASQFRSSMQISQSILMSVLLLDIADALEMPPSSVAIWPANATALCISVQGSPTPGRLHDYLTFSIVTGNLLNRTLRVLSLVLPANVAVTPVPSRPTFGSFNASNTSAFAGSVVIPMLFPYSLQQIFRFRRYLDVDLVDPAYGLGPAWWQADVVNPHVSMALETDLRAVSSGGSFLDFEGEVNDLTVSVVSALNIPFETGRHIRRVSLIVAVEGFSVEALAEAQRQLVGWKRLPLVTAALRKTVHPDAEGTAFINYPGNRPMPDKSVCGPGCYVPAITWCLIPLLIGVTFVVPLMAKPQTIDSTSQDGSMNNSGDDALSAGIVRVDWVPAGMHMPPTAAEYEQCPKPRVSVINASNGATTDGPAPPLPAPLNAYPQRDGSNGNANEPYASECVTVGPRPDSLQLGANDGVLPEAVSQVNQTPKPIPPTWTQERFSSSDAPPSSLEKGTELRVASGRSPHALPGKRLVRRSLTPQPKSTPTMSFNRGPQLSERGGAIEAVMGSSRTPVSSIDIPLEPQTGTGASPHFESRPPEPRYF